MQTQSITLAVAIALFSGCSQSAHDTQNDCVSRVRDVHGAAGPWAVAGYRIGERALKELNLPRQSFLIQVTHYSPIEVQYSCIADGIQAATGASLGKLNLRIRETPAFLLRTEIQNRRTGRTLTFFLQPKFIESITNLPMDRLETEGKRVAALPDNEIFTIEDVE